MFSNRRHSRILFWVGAAAVIARFLYFNEHAGSPFFHFTVLDEKFYDALARALVAGEDVSRLNPGFRPWLYPLFLAVCYRFAGEWGTVLALIAQHLLGALTAVLVADLAIRLFKRLAAGVAAGAFYLLAGPPLFFEGELLITSLFTFLAAAQLWILSRADPAVPGAARWWLAAGLWTGLAVQARPNALLFLLAYPAAAALLLRVGSGRSRRSPAARSWLLAGTALAGALITMSAFAWAQQSWIGRFQLVAGAGGVNFYLGNKPGADGMVPRQDRKVTYGAEYRDSVQVFAEELYREEMAEERAARGGRANAGADDPAELSAEASPGALTAAVSRFWLRRAVGDITDDPGRWLGLVGRKVLFLAWTREIPNNKNYDFILQQESRLLRFLPVRWWLLFGLGGLGILHALRLGDRRLLFWIVAFLSLHGVGIVLFFVNSRYRIPMWPGMAILAAGGLLSLVDLVKRRARWDLAVAVLTVCGLAVISSVNWLQIEPPNFARDYFFRSLAHMEKGQLRSAQADALRSVALNPVDAAARFQLGNAALALKQDELAYRHYRVASGLSLPEPRIFNNLGVILEGRGRPGMAYERYRRALRIAGDYAPALINSALLELRAGLLQRAEQKIVRASELGTESVLLECARAFLERDRGRPESAAKILIAAHRDDPETVERLVKENRQRLRPEQLGDGG